jgi:hypothetical protein
MHYSSEGSYTKVVEIKPPHYRIGFGIMVTKDFYHFDKIH